MCKYGFVIIPHCALMLSVNMIFVIVILVDINEDSEEENNTHIDQLGEYVVPPLIVAFVIENNDTYTLSG